MCSIPARSSASASTTRTTSWRWATSSPSYPTLFAKFAEALIGAHDDIVLPPSSEAVDWEVELAVVIGRAVRHASAEAAAAAIAGFTVANDVSMRD